MGALRGGRGEPCDIPFAAAEVREAIRGQARIVAKNVASRRVWRSSDPRVAQDFPARPVTLISPFPAGGATDILARLLSEGMRPALGQQVLVQSVPGAGRDDRRRPRHASRRRTDIPLSIGNWTSHVGAAAVYPVPWNVLTDLEPIAMLSTSTLIIVGRTGLAAKDGKELIAWLKANPDQATMAHVGAGSGAHVCGIYFEQKTGTRVRYVPYKGGAPSMADLMANQVDLFCGEASQMLGTSRAGRIKPLIVMSKTRWRPMPEIPTMADVGASDAYIRVLARPVGAEGHAEARHRAAERRRRQGLRRSRGNQAADGAGTGHAHARADDAAGARARSTSPRSTSGGRSSRGRTSRWSSAPRGGAVGAGGSAGMRSFRVGGRAAERAA